MNKPLQLLTAFTLLLLAHVALAQAPFASVPMPAKNVSRMMAATNPDGDVCLLAFGMEKTDFTVIDNQGQAISKGSYSQNFSSGSSVLGVLGLPGAYLMFGKAQQYDETLLQPYRIDRNTGGIIALEAVQAVPDPKGKLVKAFNANGRLYMLYINKKTNTLYVSIYKDSHQPEVRTYQVEERHLYDRLFKNGELQVMEPGLDQSMSSNFYINKIYTYPDSLALTFDLFENPDAPNRTLTTELLTLDLRQDKASFKKLPALHDTKGLTFNSYLHQGNVYRFILTKTELRLQIHHLATDKIQKHYYYTKEDSISIMTAGVFSVGTENSWSPGSKTLQTTEKVLRKMGNGFPAIAVQPLNDTQVQLTVGTYTIQQSRNSTVAGGVGRGIASAGSAAGPAALPLMLAGLAFQTASYALADGAGVSTYFQSILTTDTHDPFHTPLRASIQDKIREYEKQLATQKLKLGGALLYRYQGQVHYAYLDKADDKLVVTSFSR